MTSRFQGSGRLPEGGFLSTHKHDFNMHHTGVDWRHGATDIEMEPILATFSGATVQATLEQIAAMLAAQGSGFVSVGKADGYDGYAAGVYNVGGATTPTLFDAFTAAFGDARLVNGGIVLLLAGTYQLLNTITVPPGITIMGEMAGSIIINHGIEQSMFKVSAGTENTRIGGDSGSGTIRMDVGEPLDTTSFINMIFADNLDGYVTSGGAPISVMQTVPMIDCEKSSNVEFRGCKFIGRINNGPVAGRAKTESAIGGYTTGGGIGTKLNLEKCYFDGFGVAINFIPGNGDIDHLTMTQCRARVFGREDAGDLGFDVNCFVNTSVCNITATQNYFIADSGFISTGFVTSVLGGGSSDVNILISGTTGGTTVTTSHAIFENITSLTGIKAIVNNSNWNSNIGPGNWFVTVGGGAGVLEEYGDFNGTGAIDTLLASTGSHFYPVTVFVNGEGPYTITNNGSNRFDFIGNRDDGKRPVFNMNLGVGAPTDEVGNKFFAVGSKIENITFRSVTGTTSDFHTIRPGASTGRLIAKGCEFIDTALSPAEGIDKAVAIVDCKFDQTNSYSDNISLMVSAPDNESVLTIERCIFTGQGYAGLIGEDSGIGYDNNPQQGGSVILRNCIFDKSGATIDDASPLTIESYLVIDAPQARVLIDNCQMIVSRSLAVSTAIVNATLDTTYLRHIYIQGRYINVSNSLFQGPSQTFDVAAVNYPLPVVEFVPIDGLNIDGSRFLDSVTQIGNSVASFDSGFSNGITISNSEFANKASTIITQTLLDIDLDPTSDATQGASDPYIRMSGNNFHYEVAGVTASNAPFHTAIGSSGLNGYTVHGAVQIYAKNFVVNVSDNKILGQTRGFVTAAGLVHSSGLVINNFDDSAGGDSALAKPITVSGNNIKIRNEYTTASAANSASVLYLKGTDFIVSGNHLNIDNDATPSSSFIGVAVFDNRDTLATNAPSPAMITGNVFSNSDDNGLATSLLVAWLRNEAATEGNGYIVDNVFSETAGAGSGVIAAFEDQGTGLSWIVDRNRNQQVLLEVQAGMGMFMLNGAAIGPPVVSSTSTIVVNHVAPGGLGVLGSELMSFIYRDDPATTSFEWTFNAQGYIPVGAEIIDLSVRHDAVGGVPDSTNTLTLRVFNTTGGGDSSAVSPSTSPTTTTLTTTSSGGAKINNPAEMLYVQIHYLCDDSGAGRELDIIWVTLTYKM